MGKNKKYVSECIFIRHEYMFIKIIMFLSKYIMMLEF